MPGSNVSASLHITHVAGLELVAWEKLHYMLEQYEICNTKSVAIRKAVTGTKTQLPCKFILEEVITHDRVLPEALVFQSRKS